MMKKCSFLLITTIILLNACENVLFPSEGIYQVDAGVGGTSISEYAVIKTADQIQLYFVNSIERDPDVREFSVCLQNASGEVPGTKIRYISRTRNQRNNTEEESSEDPEESSKDSDEESVESSVITLETFGAVLPAFEIPPTIAVGQYSLVFEIRGEKDLLARTEKPFFFIGDAEFSIGALQSYQADVSNTSHLIPPSTTVLLEVPVSYDSQLNPYIVWYRGSEKIAEGRIAEGANRLLWTVPDNDGFQIIRTETFPFRPGASPIRGKTQELKLPVSSKSTNPGYFAEQADSFSHWYQFRGTLSDSRSGSDLEMTEGRIPRWAPAAGIYGLAVGKQDSYAFPADAFETKGGSPRIFSMRIKIFSDGTLCTVLLEGEKGTIEVILSIEDGKPVLTINADTIVQFSLPANVLEKVNFMTVSLGISFTGKQLNVELAVDDQRAGTEVTMLPYSLLKIASCEIGGIEAVLDEIADFFLPV